MKYSFLLFVYFHIPIKKGPSTGVLDTVQHPDKTTDFHRGIGVYIGLFETVTLPKDTVFERFGSSYDFHENLKRFY